MLAFLVGELQEDPLPLGVFEPLAVPLEETVRPALAANADQERLPIVHPLRQLVGAGGEQAVRRPLEEQEGGPGLELRVFGEELLVSSFELAEMLLLFPGQTLEDAPAARVLRQARSPGVELQPAALGGDGDAQRVPGEQQLRGDISLRRLPAGPALLALAVDLHDALPDGEPARRGDLLYQALDVRAEELVRPVAGLADEVEVARMAVSVFEAEPALAEIDLPGDARLHHPPERPIHGGAADPVVFGPHQGDQVVGAQMPFLAQEGADDQLALAGAAPPRRTQAIDIGRRRLHCGCPGGTRRIDRHGSGLTASRRTAEARDTRARG